jgi:hypothetical protein
VRLRDLETDWSIDDLQDAHDALDVRDELAMAANATEAR